MNLRPLYWRCGVLTTGLPEESRKPLNALKTLGLDYGMVRIHVERDFGRSEAILEISAPSENAIT